MVAVIEGRYAAERDAEVTGEGGAGRRKREGIEFGILKIYGSELVVSPGSQWSERTVKQKPSSWGDYERHWAGYSFASLVHLSHVGVH